MSPLLYVVLVAITLGITGAFQLDHDPGPAVGQRYPWWDRWSKWHLLGSLLLAAAAVALGCPYWPAVIITIGAGLGWEVVNGYVSGGDLLWDTLGALLGGSLAALVLAHYN